MRRALPGRKPRSLGVLVLIIGVVACVAPSLVFLTGLWALPVVVVWALVYGYADNAQERWPWWVGAQWLSLFSVFTLTALLTLDAGQLALLIGAWAATLMTAAWMIPVGLMTAHQRFWATRRPLAEPIPGDTPRGEPSPLP